MNQPDRTKAFLAFSSKSIYCERFVCSFLFIIGLLGLHSILTSSPKLSPTVYNPSTLGSHLETNPAETNMTKLVDNKIKRTTEEMLQISGNYEAKEKMTFQIPDFHNKVNYELDLGNNQKIHVTKPEVNYSYPKPGKYKVQLWGTYHNQKKLLYSRNVRINTAIEVAEQALVDLDD